MLETLRVPKPRTAAHYNLLVVSPVLLRVITYLLEVEEDRVESEEHKGNCGSEPAPRLAFECICVEPCADCGPALWLVKLVLGVRCCKDERVDACD